MQTLSQINIDHTSKPLFMYPFLRTSVIVFTAAVLLSSCVKVEVAPPLSPYAGSWVLTESAEGDAYGWWPLYTGLEQGVFYFDNSGVATYTDGGVTMRGNWYLQTVSGGFFDEYGSYVNRPHEQMQVQLYDSYSHSSINLSFDNVHMYGSYFYATYFNGTLIERYRFSRY